MSPSLPLPTLLSTPNAPSDPEDILSSSLSLLYPTAAQNQHGIPGGTITYTSPPLSPIKLHLSDPPSEESRRLFAHYVWNASLFLAEAISDGSWFRQLPPDSRCRREDWSVAGQRVLELGAGSALPSIVAHLSPRGPSEETVATDHPGPALMRSIEGNLRDNVPEGRMGRSRCAGHAWGEMEGAFAEGHRGYFSRIVAADTLWLPDVHLPLARSMAWFLKRGRGDGGLGGGQGVRVGRVWVVAGFHTGRERMRGFFDVIGKVRLKVLRRWEVDVDGAEREWADIREEEGIGEGARWVVVAVLGWADEEDETVKGSVTL
ncbi:MAG: hypothetical protein MMC23_000495 [Stictis urceolatum]|nr:hypothetical protein [Stictis urceolata]